MSELDDRVLEAVTFDFWNTLAVSPAGVLGEERMRALAAHCAETGLELDEAALSKGLDDVWHRHQTAWEAGQVFGPTQAGEALVALLGIEKGEAAEEAVEVFLSAGRGVELELAPGASECVEALAGRGVALGIVCDVGLTPGEILRESLARHGILRHFGSWAFSDEVGHYKPAAESFAAALGPLGVAPGRALHVGDLLRTDIAGARAFGMGTVRYRELNDDAAALGQGHVEADRVHDSHAQLLELIAA